MKLKYSLILLILFLGFGCSENSQLIKPSQKMSAVEVMNQGALKGLHGDLNGSLKDLSSAISLDPNLADAYYNRGFIYLDLGKPYQGLADFDKAIKLKPEWSKSYHGKGLIYLEMGQPQDALENLTTSISLLPSYAPSYYYRSFVYTQLGDNKKALTDIKKAADLFSEQGDLSLAAKARNFETQLCNCSPQ
ncbi:MAG: tetratricopeptide repeat protein [Crocosphaera sp.]|nr:tetratricopeptide repeat protein [Crocosphaera sp.]